MNGKELQAKAKEALEIFNTGRTGDIVYHPLYLVWMSIARNPAVIKEITDFAAVGTGLLLFLTFETVQDPDEHQQIATVAYFCLSKAIDWHPNVSFLYQNRMSLMMDNEKVLGWSLANILEEDPSEPSIYSFSYQFSNSRVKAITKMEYVDSIPAQPASGSRYAARRDEIEGMIERGFFDEDSSKVMSAGLDLHKRFNQFLFKKIVIDESLSF